MEVNKIAEITLSENEVKEIIRQHLNSEGFKIFSTKDISFCITPGLVLDKCFIKSPIESYKSSR